MVCTKEKNVLDLNTLKLLHKSDSDSDSKRKILMTTENTLELPKITETEKLHFALEIFKTKRGIAKFVEEHSFDVLESCKNVVDKFVVEKLAEIAKEEEERKLKIEAFENMLDVFIENTKIDGQEMSKDEARQSLLELLGAKTESTASTPRKSTRKAYKFIIGGEVVSRAFARPSNDVKEEMESNGYTEQWMLLAPESVAEFLEDAKKHPKHKAQLEQMEEFFQKKSRESGEEEVAIDGFDSKIEFGLTLDIETAKDKFNVEMTEDFVFEGSIDQLTSEQEKLLIAISDDETVEGGIEAIEALS
ncbi:hypothetical protein MA785_000840 [Vibrio parahaemolyticus]|nr:hypothetical protein [Vibrio parahaemolyticus]EJR2787949.1 hypothetical protein [Vibrio parahaemolyticus]